MEFWRATGSIPDALYQWFVSVALRLGWLSGRGWGMGQVGKAIAFYFPIPWDLSVLFTLTNPRDAIYRLAIGGSATTALLMGHT